MCTPVTDLDYVTYNDGDFGRDLKDRRSISSNIHTLNGVAIDWKAKKQQRVAEHTNGSEVRALFQGVKQTYCLRNFMLSIGFPICQPTPTYEDNQATIKQVLKDRITPQARPIDVLITSLHEHHARGTFAIADCKSQLMLADFNSHPIGGDQLANRVFWAAGTRFLPPTNSRHYLLLQLDKYPVAKTYNMQTLTTTKTPSAPIGKHSTSN